MKRLLAPLLLLAMMVSVSFGEDVTPEQKIINHLQDISLTIKSGDSQGSGTVFTRKEGEDTVSYVWTAGHVISHLKTNRSVLINGNEKTVTEFRDAQVVMEFQQEGRKIGETVVDAKVVRYSDPETGRDLALLQVRKKNFAEASRTASFYNSAVIPPVGTKLYHVGSLLGQFGSNSLTQGSISQTGRVLQLGTSAGTVFDQTSVTAFPGSSGGGVFLESTGEYVGMLVRGAGEQFNFIVPIREMRAWAKEAKVEWAIDQSVAVPCAEELAKLPIEDAGVVFAPGAEKSAAYPHNSYEKINKQFPFLLKQSDDGLFN